MPTANSRPIEPELFEREMEKLRGTWGRDGAYNETGMHSFVERQLRVQHPAATAPWRADNPQLSSREDLFGMLINNNMNQNRLINHPADPSLNGLPYIFHTCNEFYSNKTNPMPYKSTEANHVIGLRTTAEKLVYYVNWYDGNVENTPYTQYDLVSPGNLTNTSNAEYCCYPSHQREVPNMSTPTPVTCRL